MNTSTDHSDVQGRILLADDEPTFLLSTAELLRRDGFQVVTARDGFQALRLLKASTCDIIISDIMMPGNDNLDFVRTACAEDPALMVILVTAYPALQTAIDAIQLPVGAYLVKPVNFQELLARVRQVVKEARIRRLMAASQERIDLWNQRLQAMRGLVHAEARDGHQGAALDFLRMAVGNLAGTLVDMGTLLDLIQPPAAGIQACTVENCPRLAASRKVIWECVEALEKTKTAFKSKSLAQVRIQLEGLLQDQAQPPLLG